MDEKIKEIARFIMEGTISKEKVLEIMEKKANEAASFCENLGFSKERASEMCKEIHKNAITKLEAALSELGYEEKENSGKETLIQSMYKILFYFSEKEYSSIDLLKGIVIGYSDCLIKTGILSKEEGIILIGEALRDIREMLH